MAKTKKIKLKNGNITTIDFADWKLIKDKSLFASIEKSQKSDSSSKEYRAYVHVAGKSGKKTTMGLHRFLLDCPKDMVVLHLDGDMLNNTRANLIMCKRSAVKEIRSKVISPKKKSQQKRHLKVA